MVFKPNSSDTLHKHIDYYWIVRDSSDLFRKQGYLNAYPGITPDLILVLDGHFNFKYQGRNYQVNKSQLYSFLHDKVTLNLSSLKSFILIKFKSRGLSSLLPFVNRTSEELMQQPIIDIENIFGKRVDKFVQHLYGLTDTQIVDELDDLFCGLHKKEREGFLVDMAQEISVNYDLQEIMNVTNYSYSTLERHFKRDTGLTPKKFQSLRRAKLTVQEICNTKNNDWHHYVDAYGYFDQSHFCKEIKRYTSLSPSKLVTIPSFVACRPQ